jgi:hypothetical protein
MKLPRKPEQLSSVCHIRLETRVRKRTFNKTDFVTAATYVARQKLRLWAII